MVTTLAWPYDKRSADAPTEALVMIRELYDVLLSYQFFYLIIIKIQRFERQPTLLRNRGSNLSNLYRLCAEFLDALRRISVASCNQFSEDLRRRQFLFEKSFGYRFPKQDPVQIIDS